MVNLGRRMTSNKSRITGWYHSPLTIEPEPNPIHTSATLTNLCITYVPLATYKLFARAYVGKYDSSLNPIKHNNITKQKWINMYDIMLDSFKGAGRCVAMDSVYMGDVMAQIGSRECDTNMVGTVMDNQTGAGPESK